MQEKILVVDDDPDAREFIRTVLGDDGATIIEAEDGRDVYFPHEVVEGRRGFDDLRRGQVAGGGDR